jgi:hypothetical protein
MIALLNASFPRRRDLKHVHTGYIADWPSLTAFYFSAVLYEEMRRWNNDNLNYSMMITLTPQTRVILLTLVVPQPVTIIPCFYGTQIKFKLNGNKVFCNTRTGNETKKSDKPTHLTSSPCHTDGCYLRIMTSTTGRATILEWNILFNQTRAVHSTVSITLQIRLHFPKLFTSPVTRITWTQGKRVVCGERNALQIPCACLKRT